MLFLNFWIGPIASNLNGLVIVMQPHSRRKKILLLICLNLILQVLVAKVIQLQQAALVTVTNTAYVLNCLIGDGRLLRLHPRSIWRLDRESPFVDRSLLASHTEKEFTRRLRVKPSTFFYLCSLVAPDMQKSNKGGAIPLEKGLLYP